MAKKTATKIINAVATENPVTIAEAIVHGLNSRVRSAQKTVRRQMGEQFFELDVKRIVVKEDAQYQDDGIADDLATAIDYVIDQVEENGDESLNAAITQAANIFGVSIQDLEAFFNDNDQDGDAVRYEGFLGSLQRVVVEGKSSPITFKDKSAAKVAVTEAKVLLDVYGSLKEGNQKVMLDLMSASNKGFTKMLTFAQGVA